MNLNINLNILIKRYWGNTNDTLIQCEYIFILITFCLSLQENTGRQYHFTDILIFYVSKRNIR